MGKHVDKMRILRTVEVKTACSKAVDKILTAEYLNVKITEND